MLFRFVEASGGGFVLADPTIYGRDVPLPVPVAGIPDPDRRDLSSLPAFGKADGFWPIEFDGTTAGAGQEVIWTYTLNAARKVVPATGRVRAVSQGEGAPDVFGPITPRQFFQALALPPYGIITAQEALDAVKTGEIPAVMQLVIDALPADAQFNATMLIAGGQQFNRADPLVAIFGGSQRMDATAIDAFWLFARSL